MVKYIVQFLIVMTVFVPNWLVPPMQITLLRHIEYILGVFLVLLLKSTSFNSLTIMKKSPINKYNDKIFLSIILSSVICVHFS